MTTRQLRRYDMFVRISAFGAAHQDRFPSMPAARAFAAVHHAVAELERRAIAQLASRQEDVGARRNARAGLVDMLRALHRTARVIQAEQPDFPDSFRLPARSAHGVLTAARLAARDLGAVARVFIDYGLPETVVADLHEWLERYEQAIRRQEIGKSARASAHAGLDGTLTTAMAAVHRLDVIVANTLRADRPAMAVWDQARRVSGGRRVAARPSHVVAHHANVVEDSRRRGVALANDIVESPARRHPGVRVSAVGDAGRGNRAPFAPGLRIRGPRPRTHPQSEVDKFADAQASVWS